MSALALLLALGQGPASAESLRVTVDSSRHQVVIEAGPYRVPDMPPMDEHEMMDHGMAQDTPLERFAWPLTGWLRGARIELLDAARRTVPRRVLHHLILVNLGRRQLLYPAYERIFGAGAETADVALPKTVGIPVRRGMPLGIYLGWHNETGAPLPAVFLRLTLQWTSTRQVPRPLDALPIYMDVNLHIGGSNTFDVPPGRSRKSWEFAPPIGGRVLGLGGHLHDFGVSVRLEDAESGRTLARLAAERDGAGRVVGVSRRLFGVWGEGLRLRANHRYRVVGEYFNPTGETRVRGAMAHLAGLFVPDRMDRWPATDPNDPWLETDLKALLEPDAMPHEMPDGAAPYARLLDERSALQVFVGLPQLLFAVHHDRTIPRHRLPQRFP